jgi:ribosomal protein L11
MENKKNYLENELINKFLVDYKDARGKEYDQTRVVGNNGYTVGQSFKLTGEIAYKTTEINGIKSVYWILLAEGGVELSLMSLMGVSSLKGYCTDNTKEFSVEFYNAKTKDKDTRTVTATVDAKFDFDDVWQPPTRNLLELAGMIAEGDLKLKGKTVTYLGTAVKEFTAKKDSDNQNGEKVKEGYKRVIETRLWSME